MHLNLNDFVPNIYFPFSIKDFSPISKFLTNFLVGRSWNFEILFHLIENSFYAFLFWSFFNWSEREGVSEKNLEWTLKDKPFNEDILKLGHRYYKFKLIGLISLLIKVSLFQYGNNPLITYFNWEAFKFLNEIFLLYKLGKSALNKLNFFGLRDNYSKYFSSPLILFNSVYKVGSIFNFLLKKMWFLFLDSPTKFSIETIEAFWDSLLDFNQTFLITSIWKNLGKIFNWFLGAISTPSIFNLFITKSLVSILENFEINHTHFYFLLYSLNSIISKMLGLNPVIGGFSSKEIIADKFWKWLGLWDKINGLYSISSNFFNLEIKILIETLLSLIRNNLFTVYSIDQENETNSFTKLMLDISKNNISSGPLTVLSAIIESNSRTYWLYNLFLKWKFNLYSLIKKCSGKINLALQKYENGLVKSFMERYLDKLVQEDIISKEEYPLLTDSFYQKINQDHWEEKKSKIISSMEEESDKIFLKGCNFVSIMLRGLSAREPLNYILSFLSLFLHSSIKLKWSFPWRNEKINLPGGSIFFSNVIILVCHIGRWWILFSFKKIF